MDSMDYGTFSHFESHKQDKRELVKQRISTRRFQDRDRINTEIWKYKAELTGKFTLYLEGDEIPDVVWNIPGLRELTIINSPRLKMISPNLGKLTKLETLIITNTSLENFPSEIEQLEKLKLIEITSCSKVDLTNLYFARNIEILKVISSKQKTILPSINNLKNLKLLDFSYNQIVSIPIEFAELTSLISFHINYNELIEIPAEFAQLLNLEVASFKNNKIEKVPKSLGTMGKLKELNLTNNNLNSLPSELVNLQNNIIIFKIEGNPLNDIPELKGKGVVQVFEHLERLSGKGKHTIEWEIPEQIVTPFQQYLNYFRDFLSQATGEKIRFDVLVTNEGLKLITEPTVTTSIVKINELLTLFVSQNTDFTQGEYFSKEDLYEIKRKIREYKEEIAFLNRKLLDKAETIKYLEGRILSNSEVRDRLIIKGNLFDDPTPREIVIEPNNSATSVHLHFHEAPKLIETGLDSDKLLTDLLEKAIRMMERKNTKSLEDLYNDEFVHFLRDRGFEVSDQTRSGSSSKTAGELDMMIREKNGTPASIIEAFRSSSCGPDDKNISSHINKLVHDYDTAGHQVNYILVYYEGKNFGHYWENYQAYISDLNNKKEFIGNHKLISFKDTGLSTKTDVKVGLATHLRNGEHVKVYHIVINMGV